MNIKPEGSVIILVLVITASITIIMATAIKAVVIFYNLALERTEYVCQIKALEALALYGIALGQSRYQDKLRERQYHQAFESWPFKKGYKATVAIVLEPTEYTVNAQLVIKNTKIRSIESRVMRKKDKWHMVSWVVA